MNNAGYGNTGNLNTGYRNTGNRNTGNRNTGDANTKDRNTGYMNTGNRNAGNFNAGNFNTGNDNTGNMNTGNWNVGSWNVGNWNVGSLNTGFFNTITPDEILVFNKKCDRKKWSNIITPQFLYFDLTEWIYEKDMTEKEKEENPTYKTTGGYLKKYEYKEAFRKSYYDLSEKERKKQIEQLKALPNFDKEIFFEISGIDIDETVKKKMTLEEIEKALGYKIEIVEDVDYE